MGKLGGGETALYLPARGKTQSLMKNKEHAEAGARPSIVAYLYQILSYSNIRM